MYAAAEMPFGMFYYYRTKIRGKRTSAKSRPGKSAEVGDLIDYLDVEIGVHVPLAMDSVDVLLSHYGRRIRRSEVADWTFQGKCHRAFNVVGRIHMTGTF